MLLRWALLKGAAVIPKSSSPERQAENASPWGFELSAAEVAAIDALANYQNARAQVERLTARAPNGGNQ